jgi:hypothetical protein
MKKRVKNLQNTFTTKQHRKRKSPDMFLRNFNNSPSMMGGSSSGGGGSSLERPAVGAHLKMNPNNIA